MAGKQDRKPPARGSGERELLKTPNAKFYARRDAEGKFTEMDQVGPSLAADVRQHAKTKKPRRQGDRGD